MTFKLVAVCRELLRQGAIAEACPLDESEETRAEFIKLDALWEQALAQYTRENEEEREEGTSV